MATSGWRALAAAASAVASLLVAAVPGCGCRRFAESGTEIRDVNLDWRGRSERLAPETPGGTFDHAAARLRPWRDGDPMPAADADFEEMRAKVFGPGR